MIAKYSAAIAALSTLVSAGPVARAVVELDPAAFAEAQQRDATATRAFSNTSIKTSDGKCLSVDKLSGDFRANLTPVNVAECGSTDGQGWDIITQGEHNDADGAMLVVSTLTQACLNFDPRRAAGNQVLLFSCGGRADGGGAVTDSQLFAFSGDANAQTLAPANQEGSCLTVKGDTVDIAACDAADAGQSFTFASDSAAPAAPTPSSLARRRAKRQDVIVTATTTEYVTVAPAADAETSFSSTTTVFVTVGDTPSAPAGGIPQVSINPSTTVTMNPGGGAQPAPTSAAGSGAAPASSTKADTGAAPSAPAGGIPQVSINPTTTVTMNPGGGAQPAPTGAASSAASSADAAPAPSAPAGGIPQVSINPTQTATLVGSAGAASTSAKADAPAASAPAGGIPQISINPSTTATLCSGAGAQPTASPKKDEPAASAPAASAPAGGIPQVSINPTATVTMNPGGGGGGGAGAQPTASAPADSQTEQPKAPATTKPAAAPSAPAGGIPQVSINPSTTATL